MGLLLHTRIPGASGVPVPRGPPPSSASGQRLEARGPSGAQDGLVYSHNSRVTWLPALCFQPLNCPRGVCRVGHVAGQGRIPLLCPSDTRCCLGAGPGNRGLYVRCSGSYSMSDASPKS